MYSTRFPSLIGVKYDASSGHENLVMSETTVPRDNDIALLTLHLFPHECFA